MVATPAASAFAAEVSLSFDRVITAAEACGRLDARRILRVSAPTTFAMRWLIPRLDSFHAERAEVEVAVTTATTLHDELRGGFDVAIRRGSAEQDAWPQYRAVRFLDEADTLIMSPALFERRPVRRLDDIAEPCVALDRDPTRRLDRLARPCRTAACGRTAATGV